MTQGTEHSSYLLETNRHRKWLVVAGRKCPTKLPVYGKCWALLAFQVTPDSNMQ